MNASQPLGSRPAVVRLATGENRILVNGFESGFAMLDSRDSNLESNPAHPYFLASYALHVFDVIL